MLLPLFFSILVPFAAKAHANACPHAHADADSCTVEHERANLSAYERMSAHEKISSVWDKVVKGSYVGEMPPYADQGIAKSKLLFACYAQKAFTWHGDEMIEGRDKLIHSSGSVIRAKWEPTGASSYTGLFATGSEDILMRMSLAKAPEKDHIIPGFALKAFIDGKESVNMFAMPSLDGQDTPGFFDHTFSNVLKQPKPSLANSLLDASFTKALRNIGSNGSPIILTTHHMAAVTPNGNAVSEVNAPYKLVFVPSNELKELTKDATFKTDFRNILEGKGAGMVLFHVFAFAKAAHEMDEAVPADILDSAMQLIGVIRGTSSFVASQYGDEVLYFRHQES